MGKDPRKEAMKKAWKQQERQKLLDSIPMPKQVLRDLFDYLDRPSAPKCDHTLRETAKFMLAHDLDIEKVAPWLRQHGGYCDCEVMFNVENEFGELV